MRDMKKMRLINPHMEPFGAGLKSVMQVCKVKCSFVNRKLNICKRDAECQVFGCFYSCINSGTMVFYE